MPWTPTPEPEPEEPSLLEAALGLLYRLGWIGIAGVIIFMMMFGWMYTEPWATAG